MVRKGLLGILKNKVFIKSLLKQNKDYSSDIYFVNVDPKEISHNSIFPESSPSLSGPEAFFGSFKGLFDMAKIPFEFDFMYRTVRQLLNGEAWEQTPYYYKLLKYKSKTDGLHHFKKLQKLIDVLLKDGYLSQYELGRVDIIQQISKWKVPRHELMVGMDRNGQFFRIRGGRHRLAIAQNIGISEIPAILTLYHQNAMNKLPVKHRVIEGKMRDYQPFEEVEYEVKSIK